MCLDIHITGLKINDIICMYNMLYLYYRDTHKYSQSNNKIDASMCEVFQSDFCSIQKFGNFCDFVEVSYTIE